MRSVEASQCVKTRAKDRGSWSKVLICNSPSILNRQPYKKNGSHKYSKDETELQIALIAFGDRTASNTYRNTTAKQHDCTNQRNHVINRWSPVNITDFQVEVRSDDICEDQCF